MGSSAMLCRIEHDLRFQVGSTVSDSFSLVAEGDHQSTVMAARETIDITSSDSESWDLDEYRNLDASPLRESATSADVRILPPWASAVGTSSRGHVGSSQDVPSPQRTFNSNGSSSNFNSHKEARHQTSRENGYEKNLSQQALKRTLPMSIQPSEFGSRASNLLENVTSSHIRDMYGKSHHYAWSNLPNSKNRMKDHFGRSNDDEIVLYDENYGNRILPPSFMHGKPVSSSHYNSLSDPIPRPSLGEERGTPGSDERLTYQAALLDLNQPKVEANIPDGLLSVSLLRHQKIALAWMLQKETRSLSCLGGILADDQGLGKTVSMIALIQMQRSLQPKSKSESQCSQKTEALNLDDDDDSVCASVDKGKHAGESDKSIPESSTVIPEFRRQRPAAGTLIVCPASVLRQWARELDDKVAKEAKLTVLVYHGSNRTKDPVELANYDVVLTTYAIVSNEVPKQPLVEDDDDDLKTGERFGLSSEFSSNKKQKKTANVSKKGKKGRKGIDSSAFDSSGALAKVVWFRVVLDEAQTIKNHRTQVARACCGLRAKRRWCLSGTPIQNAIDELYSYFRFLKYDPYATYKSFCHSIKFQISRNSFQGYKKLQAVLRVIMLRRTKGTLIDGEPIISLPPKTTCLTKVDFSAEERAFYLKLEADSRSQFKAYAAAGTVNQNYANILLMLLRLRQACDHPLLVKGHNSDPVGRVSSKIAKRLPRDMLVRLLNLLETSLAICRVCNDPPEDAVVTMCGHVFCYQCVSEYLTGDDNMCPAPRCKEQLGADAVFSKATLRSCISEDSDSNSLSTSEYPDSSKVLNNEYSSSKIRAALEILQSHCKVKSPSVESHNLVRCNGDSSYSGMGESSHSGSAEHPMVDLDLESEGPLKAIVFSQWTSMLDLVEVSLNQSCIQYRRLDGTMTLASRDRAVKEFSSDPEVTVMLMSLKAGNLGLNMVAACHVILLDLWWNPTTEDQAVDRAHRIGQTRPVTVSRITIKDTVEDRILALQEEKRKMVASAFGEDPSGGSATRLTVDDLKYLFNFNEA